MTQYVTSSLGFNNIKSVKSNISIFLDFSLNMIPWVSDVFHARFPVSVMPLLSCLVSGVDVTDTGNRA